MMNYNAMLSGLRDLVDNPTPRENTTRYAQHMGYKVNTAENGGEWTLTFTK